MQSRPDFQAKHVHKEAGMAETFVIGCQPIGSPVDGADPTSLPNWSDVPHPPTAEDGPVTVLHLIRFHPGQADTEMVAYQNDAATVAVPHGVRISGWFGVEGTIVGDGRQWDQARFNAFPSKAAFMAVVMDPARLEAQHAHREAAIADTYTMILRPRLDRLAKSTFSDHTRIEHASPMCKSATRGFASSLGRVSRAAVRCCRSGRGGSGRHTRDKAEMGSMTAMMCRRGSAGRSSRVFCCLVVFHHRPARRSDRRCHEAGHRDVNNEFRGRLSGRRSRREWRDGAGWHCGSRSPPGLRVGRAPDLRAGLQLAVGFARRRRRPPQNQLSVCQTARGKQRLAFVRRHRPAQHGRPRPATRGTHRGRHASSGGRPAARAGRWNEGLDQPKRLPRMQTQFLSAIREWAPKVTTQIIFGGYALFTGQLTQDQMAEYLPSDRSLVDVIGTDPFGNDQTSLEQIVTPMLDFAASANKPLALDEVGVRYLNCDRTAWVSNALTWIRSQPRTTQCSGSKAVLAQTRRRATTPTGTSGWRRRDDLRQQRRDVRYLEVHHRRGQILAEGAEMTAVAQSLAHDVSSAQEIAVISAPLRRAASAAGSREPDGSLRLDRIAGGGVGRFPYRH